MESTVEAEVKAFENQCPFDIDWDATPGILKPTEYVEHWRVIVWDKAFRVYFDEKAELKFTKGVNILEFEEGPIAVKRVAYRYAFYLHI